MNQLFVQQTELHELLRRLMHAVRDYDLMLKYASFHEVVYNHGEMFTPSPLESPLAMTASYIQHIHTHCLSVAQRVSAYRYVEGFILFSGRVVPTVWLADAENHAYDLFFEYDPSRAYFGIPLQLNVVQGRRWSGVFDMRMEARAGYPILSGQVSIDSIRS